MSREDLNFWAAMVFAAFGLPLLCVTIGVALAATGVWS